MDVEKNWAWNTVVEMSKNEDVSPNYRDAMLTADAEIRKSHRLASLILKNADSLRLILPDDLSEILALARKIAPDALVVTQMRENSSPHDPGAYTLVGSPAQTGEAGAGRFEQVKK